MEQVLVWIASGLLVTLIWEVTEDRRTYEFYDKQMLWLKRELGQLLHHQAVECLKEGNEWPAGIRFTLPVFMVVTKGLKQWWLVIDMQAINKVLVEWHCKFEGLALLSQIAGKNWWMVMFNLGQGSHQRLRR